MTIELTSSPTEAPLEVIDLQVALRPAAGRAPLAVRFLYRDKTRARRLPIPALSWFEASRLQKFTQELTAFTSFGQCQTELTEAGLRLTGSVRRPMGRQTADRCIQVEPLALSASQFTPFVIHISSKEAAIYTQKLYSRLWEVFTRA